MCVQVSNNISTASERIKINTWSVTGDNLLVNAGTEPFMTDPHVSLGQLEQIAESYADSMCRLLVRAAELTSLQ